MFKIQPSNVDIQEIESSLPKAGKVAKVRSFYKKGAVVSCTRAYLIHWFFFLPPFSLQFFVRAMFDYDPANDNLLPCQDIGLSFKRGDILEVSKAATLFPC